MGYKNKGVFCIVWAFFRIVLGGHFSIFRKTKPSILILRFWLKENMQVLILCENFVKACADGVRVWLISEIKYLILFMLMVSRSHSAWKLSICYLESLGKFLNVSSFWRLYEASWGICRFMLMKLTHVNEVLKSEFRCWYLIGHLPLLFSANNTWLLEKGTSASY